MEKVKKIGVGVIGLGHWGPNLVRNFAKNLSVDLKYVCDLKESCFTKVNEVISENCVRTKDCSDIFNDPDVEAVIIATPASQHYPLAKKALLKGKHVLCEKPLTLKPEEGEDLQKLSEEKDLTLMVGHTFLFNNAIIKLKEIVKSGVLGKIYYLASQRTHLGLVREDVSAVWDLAPHDVYIFNYLLDFEPIKVSAIGSNPLKSKNEDFAFLNLFYPNNIIGNIHVSWINSNKVRCIDIIGSKGRAYFNDLDNLEPIRIFEKGIAVESENCKDFGEFKYSLRDGNIISPSINMKEPLRQLVDEFVDIVKNKKRNIPSDARSGVHITKVLIAAHKSINQMGNVQNITY